MGSVLKLANPPSPTQTISKTEQNVAENESLIGAALPEGWKDEPNLSRTTNCH